jgi:dienelactone hydrolase
MVLMRKLLVSVGIATALLGAGCTASRPPFPSEPAAGTIFNAFRKPQGDGPFPAVVLLHTCGGIRPHVRMWAERLEGAGFASLIVDSFTWRGAKECSIPHYFPASIDEVAGDGFAALEHLRGRPDIDPARIGVMGFSWGANATLRTSSARYRRDAPGGGFRAAVAFYPMCVSPRPDWPAASQERAYNLFDDVEAPTLVLMGDADNDTPNVAQNCASRVAALRRAGRPVDIVLYPGAGHVFDSRDSPNARAAGADMLAFFRRHLTGPGRAR